MTKMVKLDSIAHADVTVSVRHGAAYGDAVNQMLVFPTEFEQLQRHFPILFRRDDQGAYYAVALLGFALNENLFLGPSGWDVAYVPVIQRRGPFVGGAPVDTASEGSAHAIHIDLDDPRVNHGGHDHRGEAVGDHGDANDDGATNNSGNLDDRGQVKWTGFEGVADTEAHGEAQWDTNRIDHREVADVDIGEEPLFLRHGGQSDYLRHVSIVLETIRHGAASVEPFFKSLVAHDLIHPATLDVTVGDGATYRIEGVHTVSADALAALSGAALDELHRSGVLRAATMAASSIANIDRLVARKNRLSDQ
jgi:hypothetical protein